MAELFPYSHYYCKSIYSANEHTACRHPVALCKINMADLEGSLTAIDWLSRLKVGVGGVHADRTWPASLNATKNLCFDDTTDDGNSRTVNATGNTNGKPGYSYANLISLAINSSPERRMTLSEIYTWICDNFPYYRQAGGGWKVIKLNIFSASSLLSVVLVMFLFVILGIFC